MATQAEKIKVTSHVSRDLLQNADYFNTFAKIVWEYVSNSLDAAKDNERVVVNVQVSKTAIAIQDNGSGMSRNELTNFFQMHGENMQRRRGKRVRGRFGTGKSAAFGLANTLELHTVHEGLKNSVKLTRKDIMKASDGNPIPVKDISFDADTAEPDGTKVVVRDFKSRKRPKAEVVIKYVERHLSRYRGRALVNINGHECKFEEQKFTSKYHRYPPSHLRKHTGEIELIVKVAPIPLEPERVGIDILSHGIWHETTLAGIENRERSQYIFGEIDVPVLEEDKWEISAFDNTRSVKLNDQNPVVSMLLGWISEELEKLRLELVKEEKERRKSEQARKLAKEAERIAEILNDDFAQLEMELENARRAQNKAGNKLVDEAQGGDGDVSPGGGDLLSEIEESGNPNGDGKRGANASEGDTPRPGPSLIDGSEAGSQTSIEEGRRKRRRSAFHIEYENGTPSVPRSRYESTVKTIYINLDHLQIASALQASNGNTEGQQFREMSYEVAAIEYALALQYETIADHEFYDATAALDELRHTVNRVTSRFVDALHKRRDTKRG